MILFRYFLKAVGWARKYGIRINLDLHTLPGSQNGYVYFFSFGFMLLVMDPLSDFYVSFSAFVPSPHLLGTTTLAAWVSSTF